MRMRMPVMDADVCLWANADFPTHLFIWPRRKKGNFEEYTNNNIPDQPVKPYTSHYTLQNPVIL